MSDPTANEKPENRPGNIARVGLPGASRRGEEALRRLGIDPDRLSIFHLGLPPKLLHRRIPPWFRRIIIGYALWTVFFVLHLADVHPGKIVQAGISLCIGLIILQGACEALISATEKTAARFQWDHYVAGTVAEILSTTPELVVIAFIIPVSPLTAFIIALVTIYNNALVFSLYSFFLPRDQRGKFLMPTPITEAGTQILIGGGAMGLILGLVMLTFSSNMHPKTSFVAIDLVIISLILFLIFAVYLLKLVRNYAREEADVRESLEMNDQDIEKRLELVYQHVSRSPIHIIIGIFLMGVIGAVLGGEEVSRFARIMMQDLEINNILTALILAVFAGMSEYIILWKSHRKKEYGIALANAFGGITQVMFLVLPFTLLGIAVYQGIINPAHAELPIQFSLSNIFLLLFLFPTFYVLSALLEEDHTLGVLDATIMTGIFILLIMLLVTYGADDASMAGLIN